MKEPASIADLRCRKEKYPAKSANFLIFNLIRHRSQYSSGRDAQLR